MAHTRLMGYVNRKKQNNLGMLRKDKRGLELFDDEDIAESATV